MALGRALAIMLSASTAISGVFFTTKEFKLENINNIKNNLDVIEKTLKTNEVKLVDKYNELYKNANSNIESLEKTNQDLLKEIEKIKLEYEELLNKNQSSSSEINKLKEQLKSKDEYIKQIESKLNNAINDENINSINKDNTEKENHISTDEVEQVIGNEQEVIEEKENDTFSDETISNEVKTEIE